MRYVSTGFRPVALFSNRLQSFKFSVFNDIKGRTWEELVKLAARAVMEGQPAADVDDMVAILVSGWK
jgi:hypothetical protein